jgi:hypothetical protein
VVVGRCVGVCDALAVTVGVAGGFVVCPARDGVGLTLGAPCELDTSRTATTAMMTAAAATTIGQRHRRQPDGGPAGGIPPVPPGAFRPAAVTGPDAGTKDVSGKSGPRLRSALVAATESAAPPPGTTCPGTTGSSVVGS